MKWAFLVALLVLTRVEAADVIDSGILEGAEPLEGDIEAGGIIMDQTITRWGHEFVDDFNRHWRPPEGGTYRITFHELNSPIRGSQLTVKVNETQVYEGVLTPNADAINELAKAMAKDIASLIRTALRLEDEEFF